MKISQFEPNLFGLYKPAGSTPLQALEELKKIEPDLAKMPLTYAGRLDPMAEGLLMVLAGDAVHKKDEYLKLDKEYVVTALLGMETDSFDLLGVPLMQHTPATKENELAIVLQSYIGITTLPLPPYSSPPYKGKPLFWWARQRLMNNADTPVRESTMHSITSPVMGTITGADLLNYITTTIAKVKGDFRQGEILQAWRQVLPPPPDKAPEARYVTVAFSVQCASGTYIRALVHDLGKKLGTGACVYTLARTQVGPYHL